MPVSSKTPPNSGSTGCGSAGKGLITLCRLSPGFRLWRKMVVFGQRLDLRTLEVFSDLSDSVVLWKGILGV